MQCGKGLWKKEHEYQEVGDHWGHLWMLATMRGIGLLLGSKGPRELYQVSCLPNQLESSSNSWIDFHILASPHRPQHHAASASPPGNPRGISN